MNLEKLSREDMIVGGLALLLAIFLLVLPWFDVTIGPFSTTFSATGAPDGWLGILAFIAALAVVADLAIERFSPQTEVPAIGNRTNTRFVLACVAAFFVALKFLFHIHFTGTVSFAWGFYVIVILTGALVYFALEGRNAAPMTVTRPGRTTSTTATPPGSAGTPPGSASQPPPGSSSGTGPAPGAPGAGPTAPPEPGGSTTPPRD